MKIIDRYIATSVIRGVFSVWALLLSFMLIVTFITEFQKESASYTLAAAAWFAALRAPYLAYQVFPFAALIGTLVSIGGLGSSNELVALRSSGVSRQRLTVSVLMGAVILLIPIMLVGEYLAPDAQQAARTFRFEHKDGRIHLGGSGGLWIRDGRQIVNIRTPIIAPGKQAQFSNVQIFNLDDEFIPQSLTNAREAVPSINPVDQSTNWLLKNVTETKLGNNRIEKMHIAKKTWDTRVEVGLLSSAINRPQFMSLRSLADYSEYLRENGQDTREYVAAYWEKIYYPFTVFALLVMGLPFVFVMARQRSIGVNIFIGIFLGSVYLIVARWAQNLAEAFAFPYWLIAATPIVVIASIGVIQLRRSA